MLNFLIAVISKVYEDVVAKAEIVLYTNRSSLNKEFYEMSNFFNRNKQFEVLIFTIAIKDANQN